jgi:hypothetical protein
MQNGPKTRGRQPRPPFTARSRPWTASVSRLNPPSTQNAERNYERYLALARDEARAGNTVGAENYYQHAEHYYRSMSSSREVK